MTRQTHTPDAITIDEVHARIARFRRSYPEAEGRVTVRLHPDDASSLYARADTHGVVMTPAGRAFAAAFDGQGGSDWYEDARVPTGTLWIEHP